MSARTYLDETYLAADPKLLPTVDQPAIASQGLIGLAPPDTAESDWISEEVAAAMAIRGFDCLCHRSDGERSDLDRQAFVDRVSLTQRRCYWRVRSEFGRTNWRTTRRSCVEEKTAQKTCIAGGCAVRRDSTLRSSHT